MSDNGESEKTSILTHNQCILGENYLLYKGQIKLRPQSSYPNYFFGV